MSTQDEVNQLRSVDGSSSIDVHANQPNIASAEQGVSSSIPATTPDYAGDQPTANYLPSRTDASSTAQFNVTPADDTVDQPFQEAPGSLLGQSAKHTDRDQEGMRSDELSRTSTRVNGGPGEEQLGSDPHLEPNVGSDTDASRADSTEQTREGLDRLARQNSAKKPTSFKSVSVTKSFLAKTATTPLPVKLGDKSSAAAISLQPLAKPRLVAKLGSGLRDSPRPRAGADGPTDGTTVWNKNRRKHTSLHL